MGSPGNSNGFQSGPWANPWGSARRARQRLRYPDHYSEATVGACHLWRGFLRGQAPRAGATQPETTHRAHESSLSNLGVLGATLLPAGCHAFSACSAGRLLFFPQKARYKGRRAVATATNQGASVGRQRGAPPAQLMRGKAGETSMKGRTGRGPPPPPAVYNVGGATNPGFGWRNHRARYWQPTRTLGADRRSGPDLQSFRPPGAPARGSLSNIVHGVGGGRGALLSVRAPTGREAACRAPSKNVVRSFSLTPSAPRKRSGASTTTDRLGSSRASNSTQAPAGPFAAEAPNSLSTSLQNILPILNDELRNE